MTTKYLTPKNQYKLCVPAVFIMLLLSSATAKQTANYQRN